MNLFINLYQMLLMEEEMPIGPGSWYKHTRRYIKTPLTNSLLKEAYDFAFLATLYKTADLKK